MHQTTLNQVDPDGYPMLKVPIRTGPATEKNLEATQGNLEVLEERLRYYKSTAGRDNRWRMAYYMDAV